MMNNQLNFESIFNDYIEANQKDWEFDRDESVGASEVFGCIRQNFYKKNGYEPDEDFVQTWGAMERGNVIENHFVVPAVQNFLPKGAKILFAGEDQKTFKLGKLTATPDGLITGLKKGALKEYGIDDIESNCVVLEIKSIDPRANLKEEKAIHRGQTITQMGLFHETTRYKPYYGVILYVNASFFDDLTIFIIEYDEKVYENAKKRADLVFDSEGVTAMDYYPEGRFNNLCQYCAFDQRCKSETLDEIPTKETASTDWSAEQESSMQDLISKEREYKQERDEISLKHKRMGEEIKEFLRSNNFYRMEGNTWKVSISRINKSTLDTKKLKEETEIDLSSFYKNSSYERLTITETD